MAECRLLLLMYGYIRVHIENHFANTLDIPDSMKKLCASFLTLWFDIPFEWNPNRGSYELDTSITGTAVTFSPNRAHHFRMALSKFLISNKHFSKYEWELTLKAFGQSPYNLDIDE